MKAPLLMLMLVIASSPTSVFGQSRPDLVVTKASVEDDGQGHVRRVVVSVTNTCRDVTAPPSDVLVSFKESADTKAKTILFVGNSVPSLKGSESFLQSFPITDTKIGSGTHIVVEVDPYQKVAEANEDNNWLKLNPNTKPPLTNPRNPCLSKSTGE